METRECNVCGREKPLTEMVKSARYKGGYMPLCKPCRAAYWRNRRATNEDARERHVEAVKRSNRKHLYGLGERAYRLLVSMQGDKCALCGATHHGRNDRYDSWNIDHDHKTGQIRGLLCHSCNIAVGQYERIRDLVGDERLAEYLSRQILLDDLPIDPPYHGQIGQTRTPAARRAAGAKIAKLTDEQIVDILKDPRNYQDIADEYGINKGYVSDLKNGRKRTFVSKDVEIVRAARGRKRRNAA